MLFDSDQFHLNLLAPHITLFTYEVVSSTNTVLLDVLAANASVGAVVIAAQQTAGRGQWGRAWESSLGGLYLSMAIAPNLPVSQQARLTMASAWGIAKRLRGHQVPVQLKWPNDLYVHGKKLGGILTETAIRHGHIYRAVVGVGVNWTNATPDSAIALTHPSIQMSPPISSLEALAALVVNGIDEGLRSLQHQGPAEIISDYRQWLYTPLPPEVNWDSL